MFDKRLSPASGEKPPFFAFFHQTLLFFGVLIIIKLYVNNDRAVKLRPGPWRGAVITTTLME